MTPKREIMGVTISNALEVSTGAARVAAVDDVPPQELLGGFVAIHDGSSIIALSRLVCVLGYWSEVAPSDEAPLTAVFAAPLELTPIPATSGEGWWALEPEVLRAVRLEYPRARARRAMSGP